MKFHKLLELKYLEWQQREGGRKTVKEFALWMDVSQASVSMWWNGERIPTGDNIRKLAARLGPEVYDSLGLERPDPDLEYIKNSWATLSKKERKILKKKTKDFFSQYIGVNNHERKRR